MIHWGLENLGASRFTGSVKKEQSETLRASLLGLREMFRHSVGSATADSQLVKPWLPRGQAASQDGELSLLWAFLQNRQLTDKKREGRLRICTAASGRSVALTKVSFS